MKVQVIGVLIGMLLAGIALWIKGQPDVVVLRGEETACSTVCGVMNSCGHKATEKDFEELLKRSKEVCEEPSGVEKSYRDKDGSLKHTVIIGEEEVIKIPGTEFDSCIINWEVNEETALKAFKEICLERRFSPPKGEKNE